MSRYIYKRFDDVLVSGDLFRIKKTGEIVTYSRSYGGANWSSSVFITVNDKVEFEIGTLWVHEIEKVNEVGEVIDDFSQHKKDKLTL